MANTLFYAAGPNPHGKHCYIIKKSPPLRKKNNHRDMSQDLIFLPLRDHSGVTQLVYTANNEALKSQIQSLSAESVVCVEGTVRKRPEGMSNKKQASGDIEVEINKIYCLNPATPSLPFWPNQAQLVNPFFLSPRLSILICFFLSQTRRLDFVTVI